MLYSNISHGMMSATEDASERRFRFRETRRGSRFTVVYFAIRTRIRVPFQRAGCPQRTFGSVVGYRVRRRKRRVQG